MQQIKLKEKQNKEFTFLTVSLVLIHIDLCLLDRLLCRESTKQNRNPFFFISNKGGGINREKELHQVCKNYPLKGVQKPVKESPDKVAGVILHEYTTT